MEHSNGQWLSNLQAKEPDSILKRTSMIEIHNGDVWIAQVNGQIPQAEANAKLIRAASEMKQALNKILANSMDIHFVEQTAKEVLDKIDY